jgi:hypothetical protein
MDTQTKHPETECPEKEIQGKNTQRYFVQGQNVLGTSSNIKH